MNYVYDNAYPVTCGYLYLTISTLFKGTITYNLLYKPTVIPYQHIVVHVLFL